MTEDGRSPPSALKGRLADVYVPALVSGALDALSRRLGNRATIDDPLYGRASSLAAIDPLLAGVSAYFVERSATYEHVGSTTGVDRDASEGRIEMTVDGQLRQLPIAIVAERRRLREIEIRVYYMLSGAPPGRKERAPLLSSSGPDGAADSGLVGGLAEIVDGLRKGAVERALAGFAETSRVVDAAGQVHAKADGAMAAFLTELGDVDVGFGGTADDGRTACVEVNVTRRARGAVPALLAFERGDTGLVHELRVYWE
jgi:hypothetical protein